MNKTTGSRKAWLNTLFVAVCAGLLIFLYLAPEETTSPLPGDDLHEPFHQMESKKEADKLCLQCHSQDGEMPLPDTHPDPFRCLFCHKR